MGCGVNVDVTVAIQRGMSDEKLETPQLESATVPRGV